MKVEQYKALVIGSGQAGGPIATTLARAGWKTALVERAHIGGTCVNEGCTPTKTMIASARTAYVARRGSDYGVSTGKVAVDMTVVRQRKQAIVDQFRGSSERSVNEADNLDYYFGEASFSGAKQVEVGLNNGDVRHLSADLVIINTGTRPTMPDVPGLDTVPTLDSTSIMELDTLPKHLLVIGGGYIGLEFGQMFRRFGSDVTILQRGERLLTNEDPDVSDAVADILREDGIEVLLRAKVESVGKKGHQIAIKVDGKTITGSHLLVATGRRPNTDSLNLAAAGIDTNEQGSIRVNQRLETSAPGVYALGDVKGGPAFTHISYDDFRILRANLLENGDCTTEGRLVPYVVFIDPQLGRVGLTETQARQQGQVFKVAQMPMTGIARASEIAETRGFLKALVDPDTERILGCAILGFEGGEIMAMIQIAMMGKVRYTELKNAVFAHPTLAEGLNNLFTNLK